jgi:hypothetical protein
VRILDGVKIADWLREFPALGRWLYKKMGRSQKLTGITTPAEHWEMVLAQNPKSDPPFPPKVFLANRESVCSALQKLFTGGSQRLLLFAESPQDVEDFVAAYLESLPEDSRHTFANRCLFISDEEAWASVAELRASHVLVASPRLGLESEGERLQVMATRRGHAVVIPVCGAWSSDNHEIVRLRSPSHSVLESALTEAKYPLQRARELASIGADRLSALRRHLLGLGGLPPYATWENARYLAQAGLVGKWDGNNPEDRAALEILLGKEYGEWIETIRGEALRPDAPLIQRDEHWRVLARGEAWAALGPRISDGDLDHFLKMAIKVLGEDDPKFDLPKGERFAAGIKGKRLKYSPRLREGIAETLALLGARPKALSSCSEGKAETTALLAVRGLLENQPGLRWASLDGTLPLLAEAAPDEFLDAMESALEDPATSPFVFLFDQEENGAMGGWNYTSGLLWALETLAWYPDYLGRVTLILGDLAAIDPGGNWANRPAGSLADIFLPWHLQTCASLDKRRSAINALLHEQPEVGWKLLLALLPHNHGFTSGCHRPAWRNFIPSDWKESVTDRDYWGQINAYTDIAISIAKTDVTKLAILIQQHTDTSARARENILKHLESPAVIQMPEDERGQLWEALRDLARKHRRFSDAKWALPPNEVDRIEEVAAKLAPKTALVRLRHMFSGREFDLYEENANYEEQRKKFDEMRNDAVRELLLEGGIEQVLKFANHVESQYLVGIALGREAETHLDAELLPQMLQSNEQTVRSVVAGFVWGRYWKFQWEWADRILAQDWTVHQKADFLILLPFLVETWDRAEKYLSGDEGLYWRSANVNPWNDAEGSSKAVEKLLQFGRPNAAVACLEVLLNHKQFSDVALVVRALNAVLESADSTERLDARNITELIQWLQNQKEADPNELFKIEWNFVPLLNRYSGASPKILTQRLANDPAFFAEVIRVIYRSKKEREKNQDAEVTEQRRNLARNAYRLLEEWKLVPGMGEDGQFDPIAFKRWLEEAKRLLTDSGHLEVGTIQIGQVLPYSPPDPDGLWIHHAVAQALNAKSAGKMRSGFTNELFNERGVFTFTAGEDERRIARVNREKAEALEATGYTRFATAMREFAERYERDAERESTRDPFED